MIDESVVVILGVRVRGDYEAEQIDSSRSRGCGYSSTSRADDSPCGTDYSGMVVGTVGRNLST